MEFRPLRRVGDRTGWRDSGRCVRAEPKHGGLGHQGRCAPVLQTQLQYFILHNRCYNQKHCRIPDPFRPGWAVANLATQPPGAIFHNPFHIPALGSAALQRTCSLRLLNCFKTLCASHSASAHRGTVPRWQQAEAVMRVSASVCIGARPSQPVSPPLTKNKKEDARQQSSPYVCLTGHTEDTTVVAPDAATTPPSGDESRHTVRRIMFNVNFLPWN